MVPTPLLTLGGYAALSCYCGGVSTLGRRCALGGTAGVGRPRWTSPRAAWLVALFALVVACLPVLSAAAGGQTQGGGPIAGTPPHSHSHSHGDTHGSSGLAQQGLALAESQLIANHSHASVLRQMVSSGVDGVVAVVRSMNPLRGLAVVAAAVMAVVMVAAGMWLRMRAPPISGVWFGPARPGRVVIADLCVIRR